MGGGVFGGSSGYPWSSSGLRCRGCNWGGVPREMGVSGGHCGGIRGAGSRHREGWDPPWLCSVGGTHGTGCGVAESQDAPEAVGHQGFAHPVLLIWRCLTKPGFAEAQGRWVRALAKRQTTVGCRIIFTCNKYSVQKAYIHSLPRDRRGPPMPCPPVPGSLQGWRWGNGGGRTPPPQLLPSTCSQNATPRRVISRIKSRFPLKYKKKKPP